MLNHHDLRALGQQRRGADIAGAGIAPRLGQAWARPQAGLGPRRGLTRARGVAHGHPADAKSAVLRDGSAVLIRQVNGNDASLLAEGFARLSEQSRWMRFLLAKKVLSAAELRYLTEVDHRDHEALGALARDTDRGVGIARYIRDDKDPRSAEIAVTVTDDWQHRGLGTELVYRLSERAREEGIHRFTALVAVNNVPATQMLRKLRATLLRLDVCDAEYEMALDLLHPCGTRLPCH